MIYLKMVAIAIAKMLAYTVVIIILIFIYSYLKVLLDDRRDKKKEREQREQEEKRKDEQVKLNISLSDTPIKHSIINIDRLAQAHKVRCDKMQVLNKYREKGYCEYNGDLNELTIEELDKHIELAKKREASGDKVIQEKHYHHNRVIYGSVIDYLCGGLAQNPIPKIYNNPIIDPRPKKPNWAQFKEYLFENGVFYFWHFTDRSNLMSIKHNGGLYSWKHCLNNDINIPRAGGSRESRALDTMYNLEDYVRLSFCMDHPMVYRLKQEGYNLVLLRIRIDVAYLESTLFSDMNATKKGHQHGPTLEDLKRVDLNAALDRFVSRTSPNFHLHQAEVLVKNFVPLEYIDNIDNPIQL